MMHTTIAHVPGGPVPVPMQTAGGSQASQGGQPQIVQVATSRAMATAYEPQGKYTPLHNEQV